MKTPILDYVNRYSRENALRLHMPGHKGNAFLGMEDRDITEIDGADSLYEARGIIRESEKNATDLFGATTFYSTEGCSQCIRAMLYLTLLHAKQQGRSPLIAAARNAHRAFLSAAALLDLDVIWLYPTKPDSYLSCRLSAEDVEHALSKMAQKPAAVYLTSPDYLGNMADISGISAVCRKHDVLLLVDNAHGAYLRFLQPSRHPMDLGADLCCDSAHKTLPVLTGGAYLHIADHAPDMFSRQAKNALLLFGSTSPSYLILQSLDAANAYLADGYPKRLAAFTDQVQALKERLATHGYRLQGEEPLKLTILAKPYGYTGQQLASLLENAHIVCEFSDPDFAVMMLTPEIGEKDLNRLEEALLTIPQKTEISEKSPEFCRVMPVMSLREAAFSPCETVGVPESIGRILASASVGCPPAVPIAVCGERIDEAAASRFAYYGIETCTVVVEEEGYEK